jgi:hypothetical protein
MREPKEIVDEIEQHAELPPGTEERFSGYGVIGGLTFVSQSILCLQSPLMASFLYRSRLYIRMASQSGGANQKKGLRFIVKK